jgi:UDP-N-acetyl-D-glucosamine dehydrogenase
VYYHDPLIDSVAVAGIRYESLALTPETVRSMDAVVLLTAHTDVNYDMILANSSLLLDTQNKLKSKASEIVIPL